MSVFRIQALKIILFRNRTFNALTPLKNVFCTSRLVVVGAGHQHNFVIFEYGNTSKIDNIKDEL